MLLIYICNSKSSACELQICCSRSHLKEHATLSNGVQTLSQKPDLPLLSGFKCKTHQTGS